MGLAFGFCFRCVVHSVSRNRCLLRVERVDDRREGVLCGRYCPNRVLHLGLTCRSDWIRCNVSFWEGFIPELIKKMKK